VPSGLSSSTKAISSGMPASIPASRPPVTPARDPVIVLPDA